MVFEFAVQFSFTLVVQGVSLASLTDWVKFLSGLVSLGVLVYPLLKARRTPAGRHRKPEVHNRHDHDLSVDLQVPTIERSGRPKVPRGGTPTEMQQLIKEQ